MGMLKFKSNLQQLLGILGSGLFLYLIVYACLNAVVLESTFQNNFFAVIMMIPFISIIITVALKSMFGDVMITRSFRFWNGASALIALLIIELYSLLGIGNPGQDSITPFVPGYILGFCVIAITAASYYTKTQKFFIIFGVLVGLVELHLPFLQVRNPQIYALFTCSIFACLGFYFATLNYRPAFSIFMLFITFRVSALSFEILPNILVKNTGFIAATIFALTSFYIWFKCKDKIFDALERIVSYIDEYKKHPDPLPKFQNID
jgi:hypothetical protein